MPGPRWAPLLPLRGAGRQRRLFGTTLCQPRPSLGQGPPPHSCSPRSGPPHSRAVGVRGCKGHPDRGLGRQSGERLAGGKEASGGGGGGGRRRAGHGPSPLPPCAPPATVPLLGRGRRRRRREGRRRRRRRDLEFPSAAAAAAAPRLQARPPPEAPVALGGSGGGASRRPGFGNFPAATRGAGAGSRAERR